MNNIFICDPGKTVSLSLTGNRCELSCPYCGGHFLKNMKTPDSPDIFEAESILISGGVDKSGQIPFENFEELFKKLSLKKIKINFHSGILRNSEKLSILRKYADVVSFDFVVDRNTVSRVHRGFFTPEDYMKTAVLLRESGLRAVPHVMVGIDRGSIHGEFQAFDFLAGSGFGEVVLLVFMPVRGIEWENVSPPDLAEIRDVFFKAREKFTKVTLGCMRPGGSYRKKVDKIAVEAGFDIIVKPYPGICGKSGKDSDGCCVF